MSATAHPLVPGLLGILLLAGLASAQGGGGAPSPDATKQGSPQAMPPGATRESMWPAPTAEDWKKPCLVHWQRTWDDAVAVSKETGKPILICVNMDGEIASEHYAGVRYRDPSIVALYDPYVCVVASVYRHNPRDYDEQGRRILCPRFGTVTCGEHIWIEPTLYDKYFEGKRIAPRHIMVELDQKEVYDVYYAWDTQTIFTALKSGIANRPPPPDVTRLDRPLEEKVTSRESGDRTAVEQAYLAGTPEQRRELLRIVVAHPTATSTDLLRLAVHGLDLELARLARASLAQSSDPAAIDLILDALRVPLDAAERDALVAALARIGEVSPRARTLAAVFQGLGQRSGALDTESWSKALEKAGARAQETALPQLETQLAHQEYAAAAKPDDATARLEFAETVLEHALRATSDKRFAKLELEDAQRSALEAEKLGAKGWRVDAALALAASKLGDREPAYARAESAMKSLPADAQGWSAAELLALFAEGRQNSIQKALRDKQPWPPQWLADANAAWGLLERHPLAADRHYAAHHDFLLQLGAFAQASSVLDAGLERFPSSWAMHERLRGRILRDKGADGLEPAYVELLAQKPQWRELEWFAGYASIVTAEFQRKAGRMDDALAAYGRALAHYERCVAANPETRSTSDHYAALALAGRARIHYERHEEEPALTELLASFARAPEAAGSLDGLNLSPADTSRMLRDRLVGLRRDDMLARLDAALAKIPPELLQLPAYERDVPDAGPEGRRPRRGNPPGR
jgi:tetratricopeptide (TPR) repeat protein